MRSDHEPRPATESTDQDDGIWNFDHSYAQLPDSFFQRVQPTPVADPSMVIFNDALASELGLRLEVDGVSKLVSVLAGNSMAAGAEPIAQAYAGHQFGGFTMLGDGRAILLGEQITPDDQRVDIQLKGSGRTVYSRSGDGRAVLGPMLREYLISEAMHSLGIPTTRSLAVVATGEIVHRERPLPGAILTRVASSHIRVGTFQYLAGCRDHDGLKKLADYTIDRHFPELAASDDRYLGLLKAVALRQADLMARWMMAGFVHGVMNTDNVSICGETIDYGPCAFMDRYDVETVFSSIDTQGRYAYGNQPIICQWNLSRFAETLLSLIDEDSNVAVEAATEVLQDYEQQYQQCWMTGMRKKLGLFGEDPQDDSLVQSLLDWMANSDADWTNTFRGLSRDGVAANEIGDAREFQDWFHLWQSRAMQGGKTMPEVCETMRCHNPAVIPRNHLVESALRSAESGDMSPFNDLLKVLSNPCAETDRDAKFTQPAPVDAPAYRTFCGT